MTELERERTVKAAARHARDPKGHRHLWIFGGLIVVGVLVFFASWLIDRAAMRAKLDEYVAVSEQLADQLRSVGEVPEVDPPEPDEPPAPVATDDAIRAQVSDYFADNPPAQPPTVAEVTRIVARIYRENPPQDGKRGKPGRPGQDATAEQVADAVADYCSAAQCRGAQGPSPTSEEIAAAVAAYCGERGECTGPRGENGPRGDSVSGHRFERVDGDCRSVMTVERADGSTYEINSDAGEAACGPPDPPNEPGG